jgi:hypothetical protein
MEAISTTSVHEPEMDMNRAAIVVQVAPERWRRLLGALDGAIDRVRRGRLVASPRRALDREVQEFPFED